MLSSLKVSSLQLLFGLLLLSLTSQQILAAGSAADKNNDRTKLTLAILELKRDLLLNQEKLTSRRPDYSKINSTTYLSPEQFEAMAMLLAADAQNKLGDEQYIELLFLADNFSQLGMNDKAIDIYTRLTGLEKIRQTIRDSAWLQLAKLYIRQGQTEAAADALENIKDDLENDQAADYQAIKAYIQLANGKIEQTLTTLKQVQDDSAWALYQIFDIGIALLNEHHHNGGALVLHRIARLKSSNNLEIQSIRDQANLTLGFSLLKLNKTERARRYLENIKLKSHLSDNALLGIGWSYSIENNYEQALVYWLELQSRPNRSTYNYEAMLAVPFALSKENAHKQALQYYKTAQQRIESDISDLNEVRNKLNSDDFLILISTAPEDETGWLNNWLDTPGSPDKRFLPLLFDNAEFQASLQNYRTLLQLELLLQSLRAADKQPEISPISEQEKGNIEKFDLRRKQLSQRLNHAIAQQLEPLRQEAVNIIDRYQAQLNSYSEEVKFGIAQTIEDSFITTEEAP